MKHSALLVCASALLVGGAAGGYYGARALAADRVASRASEVGAAAPPEHTGPPTTPPTMPRRAAKVLLSPATPLSWSELLEPGATIAPSAKTRALAGQRVRLVGFMAEMELPVPGAFYLVPQPARCDEAGGGTADLMPASVLVLSDTARGRVVPHVPGALEVTGVLEVGNQPGPDGRMSALRLRLDPGVADADPGVADADPGAADADGAASPSRDISG